MRLSTTMAASRRTNRRFPISEQRLFYRIVGPPREDLVRLAIIAIAAAFLLIPAATPVKAHQSNAIQYQEFASAAKKKKAKPKKARVKKEEYMRAVPMR